MLELIKESPHISVSRKENGFLSIKGYKDDVFEQKELINSLIITYCEETNKIFQKVFKCQNLTVQWEFYFENNWKSFSLFLNTLIEEAYEENKLQSVIYSFR